MPWWSWEGIKRRQLPAAVRSVPAAPAELARKASLEPPPIEPPAAPIRRAPPITALWAPLRAMLHLIKPDGAHGPTLEGLYERREKALAAGDGPALLEVSQLLADESKAASDDWKRIRDCGHDVAEWLDGQVYAIGANDDQRRRIVYELQAAMMAYWYSGEQKQ